MTKERENDCFGKLIKKGIPPMTTEQVIEILHELDGCIYDTQQVALDMAIKALEQQTCVNCISREDAIMCMTEEYIADMTYKPEDIISKHIQRLRALPPVTPTQSWIPVSKKLPEESGNYLIYGKVVDYEENCVFIGEYDSDYEKFGYEENIYDSETLGFVDSEFCEYNKVIAWQPLPKPYEEKRGNENEVD